MQRQTKPSESDYYLPADQTELSEQQTDPSERITDHSERNPELSEQQTDPSAGRTNSTAGRTNSTAEQPEYSEPGAHFSLGFYSPNRYYPGEDTPPPTSVPLTNAPPSKTRGLGTTACGLS